jgi:cell shape-determining protein MreC
MDVSSKIKELKTECSNLDDKKNILAKRIQELKALVEEKKRKEQQIAELEKQEQELLASLGV